MCVDWADVLLPCGRQAGAGGVVKALCLGLSRVLMRMSGGRGGVHLSVKACAREVGRQVELDKTCI
jgi:hypothetical protein